MNLKSEICSCNFIDSCFVIFVFMCSLSLIQPLGCKAFKSIYQSWKCVLHIQSDLVFKGNNFLLQLWIHAGKNSECDYFLKLCICSKFIKMVFKIQSNRHERVPSFHNNFCNHAYSMTTTLQHVNSMWVNVSKNISHQLDLCREFVLFLQRSFWKERSLLSTSCFELSPSLCKETFCERSSQIISWQKRRIPSAHMCNSTITHKT